MRVPLSWLADFVALERPPEELAEGLTSLGLKVESIHRPGAGIEGVVAAEVLTVADHPRSTKLVIADVNIGGGKTRRAIAGARNFWMGDRVPLALPGARLPNGMLIEQRRIAGEVSDGMLCSAFELGVGDDHTGILILPAGAEPGRPVVEVLGLDDVIFEVEVTPNRPDAMSLLGIAREVSALTGAHVRVPQPRLHMGGEPASSVASVVIEDAAGCPRYLARVMTGVVHGPSPEHVQRRLAAAGVRAVSNIVDATNYALIVTGHPMHAFDLDVLSGSAIVVRRGRAGERLDTIDGGDRALDPDDLVIADAERPVALAGIMGGKESEVSETTERILLESAYFDPASVLRTSRRHALRTEASARFERGADPEAVHAAADYACSLMQDWAGGLVAGGVIDRHPHPIRPRIILLRPERANLMLGTKMHVGEMAGALQRVSLEVSREDGLIRVVAPTRRPDLTSEEDLVEEVARVVGFDRIPSSLPLGRHRAGRLTREQRLVRQVRTALAGAGLCEAYTTSLLGPADLDRMHYPEGHPATAPVRLANPITQDESLLRPSLLPGLLAAVARNVARRNLDVRLFEVGRCFLPSDELLPREPERLGIVLHGPVPPQWHTPAREHDLFGLKGCLETMFAALRVPGAEFAHAAFVPFHPGRSAEVRAAGRVLGILGELAPEAAQAWDLPYRAQLAEIDLGALLEVAGSPPQVRETPRFPAVLLDIAVSVPDEVPAADLLAEARAAGGELLEDARIFDVYRGEQVGVDRKSVALSLAFRRPDRTLSQDEAVAARDAIASAIRERFEGEVR
ncbi:MAG: phenylalanine--tRNA ligase subunit beta [Actinomycetota bacterium]